MGGNRELGLAGRKPPDERLLLGERRVGIPHSRFQLCPEPSSDREN